MPTFDYDTLDTCATQTQHIITNNTRLALPFTSPTIKREKKKIKQWLHASGSVLAATP